jgi:tetratricopeptide (TPR) repeat protein
VNQLLGKVSQAEECYHKLSEVCPDNMEHRFDLAVLAKERKDYQQAEQEIKGYLDKDPQNEQARLLLGEIYFEKSLMKHAAQVFQDILDENPESIEAHYYLSRIYRREGEVEKAMASLEQVMTLQGSGEKGGDLDKFRDTLELYEEAIAQYKPQVKEEWRRSLKNLKGYSFDTGKKEEEELEFDSLILNAAGQLEEDAVPIINIGNSEPVLAIEEEEEILKLDDTEEDWEEDESAVDLEDNRPPSLINLLSDQDLYGDMGVAASRQKPSQLPAAREAPGRGDSGIAGKGDEFGEKIPGGAAGAEKTGLTPRGESAIAESLKESVKAQQQLVKSLSRRSPEYILPIPMPVPATVPVPAPVPATVQPPVTMQAPVTVQPPPAATYPVFVPPPVLPEAGTAYEQDNLPRFARDEAEESEEPIEGKGIERPESPAEEGKAKERRQAERRKVERRCRGRRGTGGESEYLKGGGEERRKTGRRGEERRQEDRRKGERRQTEKGEGSARQELKDYLAGVRKKLAEKEKEEGAKNPVELLDYLGKLTDYLPESKKSDFRQSDARLKMEYLKSRLAGKEGLKKRIDKDKTPVSSRKKDNAAVSREKIKKTFAFLKDLTVFHPDHGIGKAIGKKLEAIISRIRS